MPDVAHTTNPLTPISSIVRGTLWLKAMNQKDWLVGGELHNGAHFPLCVMKAAKSGRLQSRLNQREWDSAMLGGGLRTHSS